MARMPSKRWMKMVEKFGEKEGHFRGSDLIYREEAATLLSRQHASFVRLVKDKMPRTTIGTHNYARKEVLKDLLAALQQGGKK